MVRSCSHACDVTVPSIPKSSWNLRKESGGRKDKTSRQQSRTSMVKHVLIISGLVFVNATDDQLNILVFL
ncbi:hypothetical protein Q8A67_004010 [Cirrhinus molitorella]|uniref:Uncharacterized protein n=1 Tax=Cirrhinus molitorella TaxID=172907 RepID=A0AA88QFJ5_9TELE|nr:hypothetical protein Q8A67_004010 [Cirrhinus molitorella]